MLNQPSEGRRDESESACQVRGRATENCSAAHRVRGVCYCTLTTAITGVMMYFVVLFPLPFPFPLPLPLPVAFTD